MSYMTLSGISTLATDVISKAKKLAKERDDMTLKRMTSAQLGNWNKEFEKKVLDDLQIRKLEWSRIDSARRFLYNSYYVDFPTGSYRLIKSCRLKDTLTVFDVLVKKKIRTDIPLWGTVYREGRLIHCSDNTGRSFKFLTLNNVKADNLNKDDTIEVDLMVEVTFNGILEFVFGSKSDVPDFSITPEYPIQKI